MIGRAGNVARSSEVFVIPCPEGMGHVELVRSLVANGEENEPVRLAEAMEKLA